MSAKLLRFEADPSKGSDAMKRDLPRDLTETHSRVPGFWMDRLLEVGDSEDIVSMLHRRQSWLAMLQDRLARG